MGLNLLNVYENHVLRKHPGQHWDQFTKHIKSPFSRHSLLRKEKQPGCYRLLAFQFNMSQTSLVTIPKHGKFCTHRVDSDLAVSQQPDTAEKSESKVKGWFMSSDHGNSAYDDNPINSMAMSSFNIFLTMAGFHKNTKSKTKRAISVLPPSDERPPLH